MRTVNHLRKSVKEAVDDLPIGICFFNAAGLMVLCNHTMYRLGFALAGQDIQTLDEMRNTLAELPKASAARKDGNLFVLSDGKVWQFIEKAVKDSGGKSFTRFLAADVTELYHRRQELEEGNRTLEEYGRHLRQLSANIQTVIREEEILNTKILVHDMIGRGIIAARQHLQSGRPMAEFDMTVWEDALRILKLDTENITDRSALEQLKDSAKRIGITVRLSGVLPEDPKTAELMIAVLRECANNAVRHSGADELYAEVNRADGGSVLTVANNGRNQPQEIEEGGGLSSLRTKIEKAGGEMTVRTVPGFELVIRLPDPKEDVLW